MTSSAFPDINVWLALSFRGHAHHLSAKTWFDSLPAAEELIFCRITQLGFLRLLTNPVVMGSRAKTQREAWLLYDEFLSSRAARLMFEPHATEEHFRTFASLDTMSPNDWTDSYLAAFAHAAGLKLGTFDKALAAKAKGAVLLKT